MAFHFVYTEMAATKLQTHKKNPPQNSSTLRYLQNRKRFYGFQGGLHSNYNENSPN